MALARSRIAVLAVLALGASPGAGAAPSIRQLVEVADISGLSVSPDGRHLAFRTERAEIERNSYLLDWYSADLSTGEIRRIGSGGDPVYSDPGVVQTERPVWTPDGRAIVYRALSDQAIGVWRAELDGSSARPLIVRDSDVESLAPSADGKALAYRLGPSRAEIERAEKQEYDAGIRVDSSVDLAQNLFRGGSINGRMASQRLVGFWFVRDGLLWRSPRQPRRYGFAAGTDEPDGPTVPAPAFQPPASNAAAMAVSSSGDRAEADWDGDSGSLIAVRAGAILPIQCRDPRCASERISALAWRPGANGLLVTFTDNHRRQSVALWDVQRNRLHEIARSDGLLSGGRRPENPCVLSPSAAYCVTASAAAPPRLERVGLSDGVRAVLFDPNADLRAGYKASVEQLSWTLGDGTKVAATLLTSPRRPPGPGPLFVNYYQCDGFLRGGEGDEWPIPALLDAGFTVACVNAAPIRGPQDALATYRTGLDAVRSLVALLERRRLIDRRKVAMGGFSFGSEVATYIAIHSDLLAALSIASAQSDPTGYWFDSVGGGDRPEKIRKVWGLGRPEETPERWALLSAALNAGRITAPTLLQLPEQEARRIPELSARLTQSRTPAELYAFPDEDHLKVQPRHRFAAYQRNLDWLRYWLQDYRDLDPARADQYKSWDQLRSRRVSGP